MRMEKRKKIIFVLLFFCLFLDFNQAQASALSSKLSGRIVLDIERNGEAWYINPIDQRRYYLGRPADAFLAMRNLGLGISELNFQRLAQAGMPITGDLELARKLAGRIVIQTEKNGEAWYINPVDLKKYYLGRPSDAFRVMRELGLGITRANLARIHKAGMDESLDQYSSYQHKTVALPTGEFKVEIIDIDLNDPDLKIITDTAEDFACRNDCRAQPLDSYIFTHNGFAGINGSYFCDLNGCSAKNYFFYPVYKTVAERLINEDQLKWWTTGPLVAFDQNNKFYYFKDSRDFASQESFQSRNNVKLQALLGNKPRLIENYMNAMIEWELDAKQLKGKSRKNAIAYRDNHVLLVSVNNATLAQLADVLKVLKVEYALNLDAGASTALFYNDEYMLGPGRDVPNAIIFSKNKN